MFHKHEWELISETKLPSRYKSMNNMPEQNLSREAFYALFDRKFIQVFRCKKCGKLNRFVEKY